ncbi:MAG: pyruvate ferredoxin oxidoreductase [Candidatus Aquicultor primus]|uniref:Pyruvate ferredoxin oxidoreductase n=1 Tax=Candidatus Aquicultor primus TaxID=1797195 RepID=A0A1F2UWE4_9ACTN|nr:MAG: pyruvate ferredoxin oxidoreductase [Candidatus Aquicultor primus]HCG99844.1 pyruvate ferredoxin oxidoreductase [Actinomycetota bacterium]
MAKTATKQKIVAMTGNAGCALAMKQINPDVVAAYPITPQTTIVEEFANYVANGVVDTEYINVESEHSAMSACIGASAAGARVMTSTSSQGLALMWEELSIASSLRLPIVMQTVNRALSGPINIHCDHSDSMGARDMGWIHLFAETAQEAYDNTIMAIKIAEHKDVRLPVMSMHDGFITSHAIDRFEVLDDADVKKFVGDYMPKHSLLYNPNEPVTFGPFAMPAFYYEQRKQLRVAIDGSKDIVMKVTDDFAKLSGRQYGLFEEYRLDDADVAIVVLGSTAGTTRYVIDAMRAQGVKVGMLKLRVFRPFPAEEIAQALSKLKAVGVMDRSDTVGTLGGPVYVETKAALYNSKQRPAMQGYVYGLGGRDTGPDQIETVIGDLVKVVKGEESPREAVTLLGVKE